MAPGESFPELVRAFLSDRRVAAKQRREGGSPGTIKFYTYALAPLIEWAEAEGVTPAAFTRQHLSRYMGWLTERGRLPGYGHKSTAGREHSPKTLTAYSSIAKSLFAYAEDSEFILKAPKFPKKQGGPKSSPAFLNDEQIEAVLAACETTRDKAIVSLLVDSALRRAELVALNWGDLEFRAALGHVYVKRGKGAKPRTSYFGAGTWGLLQKYAKSRPHEVDDPVFLGVSDESRLGEDGLAAVMHRLGKRVGVRLTPHVLRHSAARRMLARHMPAPSVQRALGHANVSLTLQLYGSFSEQMTEDAYREAFNGGAR